MLQAHQGQLLKYHKYLSLVIYAEDHISIYLYIEIYFIRCDSYIPIRLD